MFTSFKLIYVLDLIIKEYKQLAKREIKESYNSILYDNCIIVIVEGVS